MAYLCQPCNESFASEKAFDEHLNHEHSMHASDFPGA